VDEREALAKAKMFAGVESEALSALAGSVQTLRFAAGEILVREGEDATSFMVLCGGEADVVRGLDDETELLIGRLAEGDFFGEMALLDGFPRSASVRAATDCECMVLGRKDFAALLHADTAVALAILPVLSRRLRECEDRLLP
jgi:CRP-like cAMP-binding protein